MITTYELADIVSTLQKQPHLSLKETKYLSICRELLRMRNGCNHNWNTLRLVEGSGSYQYCCRCGDKRL